MDELSAVCQKKLETFRIKELKDVLTRICAAKQGRKQVLVERIMKIILPPERQQFGPKGLRYVSSSTYAMSREDIAKVIDDIYRKMWGSSALDLATQGDCNSTARTLIQLNTFEGSTEHPEEKIQCPCGSNVKSDTMKQCGDTKCMVWQHATCVSIPEDGELEREHQRFFCELCRVQHGDPYSAAVSHPLLPIKMVISVHGLEGSKVLQNVEKSFMLTGSDINLLRQKQYDLQVWSIMLNDKVMFRMHWPLHTELGLNGCPVRATARPGHQDLGINGRDDGVSISKYVREGRNHLSMSTSDGRPFCIGVRMIQSLTLQQVMKHIPSEDEGEPFDMSLARVRRSIIGSDDMDNSNDSDSVEIISECISVNLRCPMSGSRMKIAGRFRPCIHMGCFDLHTFVEINQRTRKWQCPICLTNYSLGELIIDPFLNRIVNIMKTYGDEVTEVEMKPDGHWRPKLGGEARLTEPWRSPDGSSGLKSMYTNHINREEIIETIKLKEIQTVESSSPLKIGIKRARNGKWKVKQTEVHYHPNSTSQSASHESDSSKLGSGVYNFSSNMNERENCQQQEGLPLTCGTTDDEVNSVIPMSLTIEDSDTEIDDIDVIVLSDSDEEDIGSEEQNPSSLEMLQSVAQAEEEMFYDTDDSILVVEQSQGNTMMAYAEGNRNGSNLPVNAFVIERPNMPSEAMVISAEHADSCNVNLASGEVSQSEVEISSTEKQRGDAIDHDMLSEHSETMENRTVLTHVQVPSLCLSSSSGQTLKKGLVQHGSQKEIMPTPRNDAQTGLFSLSSGNSERIIDDYSNTRSLPCPTVEERLDSGNVFQFFARQFFSYSFQGF